MAKYSQIVEWLFYELQVYNRNTGATFKNFDEDSFMCLDDMRYYYDKKITQKQYDKAREHLKNLICNADYYIADNKEMLQLHDNHTLWRLSVSKNYDGNIDEIYSFAVLDTIRKFNEITSADGGGIGCYGRSGRHVCIPITLHNLENFACFKGIAESLENEVIEIISSLVA